MYSNVKNGASLYDSPQSIINNGDPFGVTQGLYSDEVGSGTYGGIDIGKSFEGRDREKGNTNNNNNNKTNTKKGAPSPGADDNAFNINSTDLANKLDGTNDNSGNSSGEGPKDINKESANGPQKLIVKSNNTVDETLGNIKNQTNNDPDAGRVFKGIRTENGGRLADGYIDLGNGFKQAQALVRNIKS